MTMKVIQGNSEFAFDLYQQLVEEEPRANLFFSPYSVSQALAMTAEGARGETADEMGTVLRFPAEARRIGADAQRIPWETKLIHTGMASINESIAMDDPELVRVCEGQCDLVGQVEGRFPGKEALLFQALAEILSGDIFHDEVVGIAVSPIVQDAHDVGMGQGLGEGHR